MCDRLCAVEAYTRINHPRIPTAKIRGISPSLWVAALVLTSMACNGAGQTAGPPGNGGKGSGGAGGVVIGGSGGGTVGGGGSASTGGTASPGGSVSTGGTASPGGSVSTGGTASPGGNVGLGGSMKAGGATGSGATGGSGGTSGAGATGGSGTTGGASTAGGSGGSGGVGTTGGAGRGGGSGATAGSGGRGGSGATAGAGGGGGTSVTVPPSGCTEPDKKICSNEVNRHCGYTYEFWRDTGGGCMVAKADGFSMEWSEDNNVLARKGVRPGTGKEVVTYQAVYSADGTSFLGIYGWTKNPLVEYYIVDSWGGSRPPGSRGEHLGTVETDGSTYDIYRAQQVDKPSIEQGVTTFPQYWSVLASKRTSGTITVANHFSAWNSKGLQMGAFYEVSFVVEGYKSSGSGDVKMSMK
jgi:endo-1,4-beta-xylanase